MFAITGGLLYELFQDYTYVAYTGAIAIGTNPAIITSNGFQLAITSAGNAYISGGGNTVVPLNFTDGTPINAASITFQDQYFIAAIGNSKEVFVSNLAPSGQIWDPGDTAFKEGYSDNIVRCWVDQPGGEYLWLFGNDTYEVWADTGALFPFQRVQNQVYSIGCDSAWSVAGVSGYRFWLWRASVYMAQGFQASIVSDNAIEHAISTYSTFDQQNAEAFAYIDQGRIFYVLSFPVSGKTWVYDMMENQWHQRQYFNVNGVYTRYRPRVYAYLWGKHFVGDYENSRVYEMSEDSYVDADIGAGAQPLRRERIAPYLTNQEQNTRYNRLTLDMDTGVGLDVAPGAPGYDPKIVMQYSTDRGKTWSYQRQQRIGKIGETLDRVFWTQMGSARIGLTVDVWMTDPVPFSVNAAYMDTSPGDWPRT